MNYLEECSLDLTLVDNLPMKRQEYSSGTDSQGRTPFCLEFPCFSVDLLSSVISSFLFCTTSYEVNNNTGLQGSYRDFFVIAKLIPNEADFFGGKNKLAMSSAKRNVFKAFQS